MSAMARNEILSWTWKRDTNLGFIKRQRDISRRQTKRAVVIDNFHHTRWWHIIRCHHRFLAPAPSTIFPFRLRYRGFRARAFTLHRIELTQPTNFATLTRRLLRAYVRIRTHPSCPCVCVHIVRTYVHARAHVRYTCSDVFIGVRSTRVSSFPHRNSRSHGRRRYKTVEHTYGRTRCVHRHCTGYIAAASLRRGLSIG